MRALTKTVCLLAILALTLSLAALSESEYTYFPESEAYVGTWYAGDYSLEFVHMYDDYNLYSCTVVLPTGEDEGIAWIYDACSYDDVSKALTSMEIGMKFDYVVEDGGYVASEPMYYTDGASSFRINDDGTLTWTNFKEAPGENELVFTRGKEASVDYGESDLYTLEEMDAAISLIEQEFSGWESCVMHSIRYAGDECNTEENIAWLSSLGDKDYVECIEFLSTFHSPEEGGGAWEADTEYTNWNWWLARAEDGEWELLTWGY